MTQVGSLRIRRKFKTGGTSIVISERCGSKDKREVKRLNHMLDSLYSRGRLDILRSLASGAVSLMQVRDAFDAQALESLPDANTIRPLREHLFAWLDTYSIAETTRAGYRSCFTSLLRFGPKVPAVSDLPEMLEAMRTAYSVEHKAQGFNGVRSAVQAYLRSTVKRNNPLYLAVQAVEPLKVKTRRAGNPLSVGQVLELMTNLPEEMAQMFWTMCVTGMNALEYANGWEVVGNTVRIHGTKRASRERVIPLCVDPSEIYRPEGVRLTIGRFTDGKYSKKGTSAALMIRQVTWYPPFLRTLRTCSQRQVQPHDARRTFARWLNEAGLFDTHQAAYMGHGPRSITALYKSPRILAEMLEADRQKVMRYLEQESGSYKKQKMTLA
jgi:integrase